MALNRSDSGDSRDACKDADIRDALLRRAAALLPLLAGAAGATGNDDWMEQADDLTSDINETLAALEADRG